jgi:arginine decarboxylase
LVWCSLNNPVGEVLRKYADLIDQTFEFPTEEFYTKNDELYFNGVPLMDLVRKYGTPLKLTYLPRISRQIQRAKEVFNNAIKKHDYEGKYIYCYCTKSSHFKFVMEEALKNDIHIETSSAYDIDIVLNLYNNNLITKDNLILCNGFKREKYLIGISELVNSGFNCIPILDNFNEVDYYKQHIKGRFKVGIRAAADEEADFEFYTSRLGVRYSDILNLYEQKLRYDPKVEVKVLHFFINSGINDTEYYWSELSKFVFKYCELKKVCPELDSLDIGGGFKIKYSLTDEYNHEYMADQVISIVKEICDKMRVPPPNIITEFGTYTVAESGAVLYSVTNQKLQNDKELWYMIDGSFITQLPDTWGLNKKFIMLALNNWDDFYHKVHLGGVTCDSDDYYNSEAHSTSVYLPRIDEGDKLYVGFFHTGAYQESLGGYGGIQHCLIPAPRHIVINRDEEGKLIYKLFNEEQSPESMLKILGYL